MKPVRNLSNALVACACLLIPLHVQAQKSIAPVKTGVGYAGMVGNIAELVVAPWDGSPCQLIALGTGGLNQNYVVHGTIGNDWYFFVGNTMTFCGKTMTPLNQNGFYMDLHGMAGDDVLNGGFSYNYVYGDNGNDVLQVAADFDAEAHGGAGSDKIRGGNYPTDSIYADWDDDTICIHRNNSANYVDGGGGNDTLCGDADFTDSIEFPLPASCSACQ